MTCPASFTQNAFRGRNDDGNETTATWKANQSTNWTQAVDVNFRVRFQIQEGAACAGANKVWQLQYNRNAAGWVTVNGSSSVVRSSASPNLTDAANLTDQLTGGTGTFQGATGFDEVNGAAGGSSMDVAASGHAEAEFCVQILSGDVVNADIVELRITDAGAAIASYTQTPAITVSEATINSGALSSAGASTATLRGASTASAALSAAGASTAIAAGSTAGTIESGALSAAGSSTATAAGAATVGTALSASGASTATAEGAATQGSALSATGASTATAEGAATAAAALAADGASTAELEGDSTGGEPVPEDEEEPSLPTGGGGMWTRNPWDESRRKKRREEDLLDLALLAQFAAERIAADYMQRHR